MDRHVCYISSPWRLPERIEARTGCSYRSSYLLVIVASPSGVSDMPNLHRRGCARNLGNNIGKLIEGLRGQRSVRDADDLQEREAPHRTNTGCSVLVSSGRIWARKQRVSFAQPESTDGR